MGSMLLWLSSGRLQPCTTTFVAAAARFLHFFFHSVIRKKSWNASFHAKHFFRQNGNSNGNFCRRSPGNGASPLPETLLPPPDVDRSRLMLTDIYFVICQNFSANLGRSCDRRKLGEVETYFFDEISASRAWIRTKDPEMQSTVRTQMRFRRFFLFGHFGRVDGCYIYPLEGN